MGLRKRAEGEQKKTHKKQSRRRSKSRTRACRNNQDDDTRKRIIRTNSRKANSKTMQQQPEAPPSPSRLLSPIAQKRHAQYLERIKKQKEQQQQQAVKNRSNHRIRTALNGTIAIERESSRRRLRDNRRAGTPTKREARRSTRRIEYIAKPKRNPVPYRTSSDILMDEINAVTNSNQALLDKREAEKFRLKLRLEKKDKELQMLREELEKMKIEREQEQGQQQFSPQRQHHQITKAAPLSSGQFKTMMTAQQGGTSLDEMVAATAVCVVDDYNADGETLRTELEELRGTVDDLQESNSELRMELEKVVALAIKNKNNGDDDINEEDEEEKTIGDTYPASNHSRVFIRNGDCQQKGRELTPWAN